MFNQCNKCLGWFSDDLFKSARHWCTRCYNDWRREYYQNNKVTALAASTLTRQKQVYRKRLIVCEHLSSNPCIDCGETNILTLDFDHVRGKKVRDVASWVNTAESPMHLLQEMDKCEVVCANDHRIRTHRRQDFSYKMAYVEGILVGPDLTPQKKGRKRI